MAAGKKVALVTAGASGVGTAVARKLVEDGFQIGMLSATAEGESLAAELGGDRSHRVQHRAGRSAAFGGAGHGPLGAHRCFGEQRWP